MTTQDGPTVVRVEISQISQISQIADFCLANTCRFRLLNILLQSPPPSFSSKASNFFNGTNQLNSKLPLETGPSLPSQGQKKPRLVACS